MLIDRGMPKRQGFVWAALAQIGRQKRELKRILLAHADVNLVDSLAVIQTKVGAMMYAGAGNGRSQAIVFAILDITYTIESIIYQFERFAGGYKGHERLL